MCACVQVVNGLATPKCVAARTIEDITPEAKPDDPIPPAPPITATVSRAAAAPAAKLAAPPSEQKRRIELASQAVALNMAFYEIQRAGVKPPDADKAVPQVRVFPWAALAVMVGSITRSGSVTKWLCEFGCCSLWLEHTLQLVLHHVSCKNHLTGVVASAWTGALTSRLDQSDSMVNNIN